MAILKQVNINTYNTVLGDLDGKGSSANVIIGGSTPNKFLPIINMSKWFDEAWLVLNPSWITVDNNEHVLENNKVSLTVNNTTWFCYPLNDDVLETGLVFKDKPQFSTVIFDIVDSGNLQYIYQDTLENDYNAGPQNVTLDEYLKRNHRPLNVVGSYAVKIAEKRHNEYKTGKFAHLFRWECIDSLGNKAWCDPLRIENKRLIIGLPEEFLKNAVYPVICMGAGDTIGYTSAGASYTSADANYVFLAGQWSPSANGTLDNIQAYLRVDSDISYTLGVYDESGGEPNNRVAQSTGGSVGTGTSWRQQNLNDENISSGTNYFLGFNHASGDTSRFYYDSGTGGLGYEGQTYSAGNLPASITDWHSYTTNRDYSIYCNYTAAGGTTVNSNIIALFDIRNQVNSNLQALFDILNTAYSSLSAPFDIFSTISSGIQSLFDIRNTVQSNLESLYDVRNIVYSNVEGLFDLLNTVNSSLAVPFDILSHVSSDLQALWDMRNIVNSNLIALYDVAGRTGSSLEAIFDIENVESVHSDMQGLFDVLNAVSSEDEFVFDILNKAHSDIESLFDLRNKAVSNMEGVFDVRTVASSNLIALYDMAGKVSSDLTLIYAVLLLGGKGRGLSRLGGNLTLH